MSEARENTPIKLAVSEEQYTDWRDRYTPPDRPCPDCETESVVSGREAELVYLTTTGVDYLCPSCHISD